MALKDILNNAKYGDDMVLTLPDGTTATVGEFRSLSAEERTALQQRLQTIEQAEMALAQRVQEAQSRGILGNGQAQAQPNLTEKQIRAAAVTEFGLDENDPILGTVVKAFKEEMAARDARIDTLVSGFTQLSNVVKSAVSANLEETYAAKFNQAITDLPASVRKDVKLDDVLVYAKDHGLMDKHGRYDVNSAVDRMTWDKRKEAEREELRKETTKQVERQAQHRDVVRPRTSGPEHLRDKTDFNPLNEKGRTKSFDEVLAEASNDSDLLDSALRNASFGVVQ